MLAEAVRLPYIIGMYIPSLIILERGEGRLGFADGILTHYIMVIVHVNLALPSKCSRNNGQ
jgi:hypothetical protein